MEKMISLAMSNESITSEFHVICHPKNISSGGIYHGDSPLDFSLPLLLLQVIFLVIITNIVRFILRPLKQPAFVSYLIGGLLVGPSGFGRWKSFTDIMFPERSFDVLKIGASIGSIYYIFIIGVKYDPKLIINSGKKALVMAFISAIIPFTLISSFFLITVFITKSVKQINYYLYLAATLSLSSFPNLIPILNELKLLNSRLGRLAISSSTNHNVAVWVVYMILGILKIFTLSPYKAFGYVIVMVALMISLFCIIRPMMFSVIRGTQERPLDNNFIVAIFLGVLFISLLTDFIGDVPTMGALFLGLAMPEGPPLGAALVRKCETIIQSFFLPLVYATIGLKTNVFAIYDWMAWRNLQFIIILGYAGKLLGTILASHYLKMSFDDSLSLAFIMNFKDLLALIAFVKVNKDKVIDDQTYTTLVLSTLAMTAIATPLVRRFSRNTKTYMPYGLRTIQHTKPNTELRVVTCVHARENIPCMIKLLETTCTTSHGDSPLFVWNLNLVDLDGLASPMLIPDSAQRYASYSRNTLIKQINNEFQGCKQRNGRQISIQSFTSVAPYKTMHHDVCLLALEKKASLIIMPFYKKMDGAVDQTLRNLNSNILCEAPCSVGIVVDRRRLLSNSLMSNPFYHICVVFFGGADDREALSYGLRMVGHPDVKLDVVRILANDNGTINKRMRQMDDRQIAMFRIKCAGNHRVAYREEMVYHCSETIAAMRCMTGLYDLMLVGRRHDNDSLPLQGLSQSCENPELGVIGDFLSSSDFSKDMVPAVLVLQQQNNSRQRMLDSQEHNISQVERCFAMTAQ